MISYNHILMRTKSVQTHEWNTKNIRKELKEPVVTYNVSVSNTDAYDLGELYDMMRYASERGCGQPVQVQFTIEREY
jgi:hypothetical protein